jgi:hypothetical protein
MSPLPPSEPALPGAPGASLAARRQRESHARQSAAASQRRGAVCVAFAVVGLGGTVAIHFGVPSHVSQALQDWLRGWGLHFFAVFGAVAVTALLMGYHRAEPRHALRLLTIALWTPLGITLAHEAGQSIWPARDWEAWDSARDALLNVLGAMAAWWLLPVTVGPGNGPVRSDPRR